MTYIAPIKVESDDRPRRGDAYGEGAESARARRIESRDGTVRSAHEAVGHARRVVVSARNRPRWVNGEELRALECAFTRAWNIERGDGAVRGAHEAMQDAG